ncbi:hypothetical protein QYF36_016757 [Acer negundo]|nr:hypothetical protein QYF36_016757 [Acer negundo]
MLGVQRKNFAAVSTNQGFLGSITSDYEIQVLASYQLLTSSFVSYEIFELDSSCYESNCISEVPVCKEVRICDLLSLANGGGSRGNNLKKKSLKWFEQSTLKPKLEPLEVLVTQLEGFENDEMSLIQVEAITEGIVAGFLLPDDQPVVGVLPQPVLLEIGSFADMILLPSAGAKGTYKAGIFVLSSLESGQLHLYDDASLSTIFLRCGISRVDTYS